MNNLKLKIEVIYNEKANPAICSSRKKLVDDITAMIEAGFDDDDFLRLATMAWFYVINPDKPDAVYKDYPELTQYVTEGQFLTGNSEAFQAEYLRRFTWNDKNM
ncbi:MAG TPA: hypothetical protein VF571_20455 [Pyrinomonadaceae bacterium]|jgi:hypothetical protein